jgi:LCP family protein required for cell wall assembly
MKDKQPFSLGRSLWKLICLTLGLVPALMLLATAGFRYLADQVRFSSPAEVPLVPETVGETVLEFLDPTDVNWTQLASDVKKTERRSLNILLIGQDRRETDTLSRADSILLCSFRKDSGSLVMTSFLRDLYLPIPGHGSDRINAAYAYGGADLLKKTLTENFDIPIDGCLEVDFSRFAGIIDTLGGVRLQLRQDEAEVLNRQTGSSFCEGTHLLDGQQTLIYSRIRNLDSDGDFSRTDRQRKVVSAIVDAYRDAGLPALMKLLKQVLPMISTDMTESRLLLLALEVFPMLPGLELQSRSIPAPGTWRDKTVNGMAVLEADLDAAKKTLQDIAGG